MKKLLILLSIFFLLSNSNIKPAGRSDAAAEAPANKKQRIESKEEKEKTEVGRSPNFNVKDDKVMKEIALAYQHIPAGISGLILDYCKSKFESGCKLRVHTGLIESLIALDRTHFASGSIGGVIKIWQYIRSTADAPEKYECIQTLYIGNGRYGCTAESLMKLDERHFVSGFSDGTIKIWEFNPATENTVCIQTLDKANGGHTSIVNSLIKSDDTHFTSGSSDGTEKIWEFNPETSTARCIQALDGNNGGHRSKSLIALDKTHFASASYDTEIKIWQLIPATASSPERYECIHTLDHRNDGHTKIVSSLIKLDERHFASGSIDETIKIWEFIPATSSTQATCACVQKFTTDSSIFSLTRMSNGDLIAGLDNGVIQIFKPVVDIE